MKQLQLACAACLIAWASQATEISAQPVLSHKLDLQVRADERSSRDIRYQYRARYYPALALTETWSAHAFAVTGDDFASSHNTMDDGAADYLYVRRAFARHESKYGKTELGVIPTFKGRVSSSGLSKDGWIKGVRYVRNMDSKARLELVLGQLDSTDPSEALRLPEKLNYLEMEYSATLTDTLSYEVSLERMTNGNFLRGEVRHKFIPQFTGFVELIARLGSSRGKFLFGADTQFSLFGAPTELTALYAYVNEDFGPRAELTEDFIDTGHGVTAELTGNIRTRWDWFLRFDATEQQMRFIAGVKWSL